ncbi:MAG: DUF2490 domain-containing protein [Croceitalea sp.]|nr:DUF2490 domain-containing protein [Croceitalea sp.]
MSEKSLKSAPNKLVRSYLFVLFFSSILFSFAQQSLEDATGTWVVISGENALNRQWSVTTEGILRSYNMYESTEFGLLRSGITFHFNTFNDISLGLVHLDSQPFDHSDPDALTTQFWIYEQYQHKTNVNRFAFTQRLRMEHRWIENQDRTYNNRFRYRLQVAHPIGPNQYLKAFDELFFDFSQTHINQNRFYVGFGQKIAKGIKVEIGYMKNHIAHNNYDRVNMALYFQTHLFKNVINDTLKDANYHINSN